MLSELSRTAASDIEEENSAGSLYDRIARLYHMTFKFNQYGRSIERYLYANPLPLSSHARVLDAGCGTGLLTLALLKTLRRPAHIAAVDLSTSSLLTAHKAIAGSPHLGSHRVCLTQANLLSLPFADNSFELVVTSGALEYVSLPLGLSELARVLSPGGYLLHLPVKPSIVTRLLEVLFRFKTHSPQEVAESTARYFRVVDHYRFPRLDPISWTKTAILSRKLVPSQS